MAGTEHEQWLERAGQNARARRLADQNGAISQRDRLTEILWIVSRSMRSTGDLAAARSRDPSFLKTGRMIAESLGLPVAMKVFAGSEAMLERCFFEMFDLLCSELRQTER